MMTPSWTSSAPRRSATGAYLLIIAAVVAFALTAWRYFTPLSGVTGTGGALLAMFGAFMLAVAGGFLAKLPRGGWRSLFVVLSWLGALGTLVALLFLHGWFAAIAMAIGIVALLMDAFFGASRRVG